VCGCGRKAPQRHHIVYQQELGRRWESGDLGAPWLPMIHSLADLSADPRNIVWIAVDCHAAHHNASKRLPLSVLPDSVFRFALELMGAGAAFEYLRRRYSGGDPRLDELLSLEAT
jgi:hypothetical protein